MNTMAHMAVNCEDMEKSLDFYTRALGCQKAFEIPHYETGEPWIVYMYLGGSQFIELFYGGKTHVPTDKQDAGFNHICIGVEDIHTATQRVLDAGYTMDIMPQQGMDHNWQSWTRDPNGIRVELMQIDPQSPQALFIQKQQG